MYKFPQKCPLPPGSLVFVYIRDSGGDGQDTASQVSYTEAYCNHFQLTIERWFIDAAIGGGSLNKRDEFKAMTDIALATKKPIVPGILYWDVKRFARNQNVSQMYKAQLRMAGYILVSLSDNIPEGPMATLYENILEWKAEQDREDLSKDIKRGLSFLVGMKDADGNYIGIWPTHPPHCFKAIPYDTGLIRNDGSPRIVQRIIPDENLWPLGQEAFQLRDGRATYKEIHDITGLFAHVPTIGHPPTLQSLYRYFFRNAIYYGVARYGGHEYKNFVPPLVGKDLWKRVNEPRQSKPRKRFRTSQSLLTNLLECAHCHSSVYVHAVPKKLLTGTHKVYEYYLCSQKRKISRDICEGGRVRRELLDRVVLDHALSLLTPTFIMRLTERVNELLSSRPNLQNKIDERREKVARLEGAIANLLDLAELGSDDIETRIQQRIAEKDQAQAELDELIEYQASIRPVRISESAISDVLSGVHNTLASDGGIQAKRLMLGRLISKIEMGQKFATIFYRAPLHLFSIGLVIASTSLYSTELNDQLKYTVKIED